MTPDSKKNNTPEKDTAKAATTPDPTVKASKPASGESAKPNASPKDAKDTKTAKEATASKNEKEKPAASRDEKKETKSPTALQKKKTYQIVGGCVTAALLVACIGFASCNANGKSKAEASATPTASVKAETLFANAKEVTLLDANGKETADKITVATVKKSEATKASLKDWYYNDVVKNGYKYGILKFSDESGKGIYADSTGIYEGELKEDTATKGYTKPADSDLVYTIDTSKKALTKKASASASAEASASGGTDSTSDSGDAASDDSASSNTASDSVTGSSNNSGSTASKSASGTSSNSSSSNSSSNKSTNSSKKACTPYTIHHDAVTHQETTYTTVHHDAVTTQQWVQDTAAWDEQVDTGGGQFVCGVCGQTFNTAQYSAKDVAAHIASAHNWKGNYWVEPIYETVHHDATGHYETVVTQAAYDEQVPSGTKTVVDQAAWDETGCK